MRSLPSPSLTLRNGTSIGRISGLRRFVSGVFLPSCSPFGPAVAAAGTTPRSRPTATRSAAALGLRRAGVLQGDLRPGIVTTIGDLRCLGIARLLHAGSGYRTVTAIGDLPALGRLQV